MPETQREWLQTRVDSLRRLQLLVGDDKALQVIEELIAEADAQLAEISASNGPDPEPHPSGASTPAEISAMARQLTAQHGSAADMIAAQRILDHVTAGDRKLAAFWLQVRRALQAPRWG